MRKIFFTLITLLCLTGCVDPTVENSKLNSNIEILEKADNTITFKMCIAMGSVYNLKPETVIDAMNKYVDGCQIGFSKIHRNAMLFGNKDYL